MAELSQLVKNRGTVKAKLTRFDTFVNKCIQDVDKRDELFERLRDVRPLLDDFSNIQDEIETIESNKDHTGTRAEFEDQYYRLITLAKSLIPKPEIDQGNVSHRQDPPTGQHNTDANQISVKLPTIELPKYDGSYEHWMQFRDVFASLIDTNTKLSNVQKLHYLRSSLTGDAASVIENLEVTNDNYPIACALLKQRFERKKKIIEFHTQAILNLPSITKESHTLLREVITNLSKNIEILRKLKQPVEQWDTIIIQVLLPKLDATTRREWEKERADKEDVPKLTELREFLFNRCSFLEAISKTKEVKLISPTNRSTGSTHSHVSVNKLECPMCRDEHQLFRCGKFRNSSLQAKYDLIKSRKLCRNCLRPFHGQNCPAGTCKLCNKSHHTLLHPETRHEPSAHHSTNNEGIPYSNKTPDASVTVKNEISSTNNTFCNSIENQPKELSFTHHASQPTQEVLLSTAVVFIEDKAGQLHRCRVLLDSGSQSNLMTNELRALLQLDKQNTNICLYGVNQSSVNVGCTVRTTIRSLYNAFKVNLSFLTVEAISQALPTCQIDKNKLNIPFNITLADPNFHTPGKIDALLGASVFWQLLCAGQIRTQRDQPIYQKTRLGWIISGCATIQTRTGNYSHCNFASEMKISNQLERFWQLEEVEAKTNTSAEEQLIEQHFVSTHQRLNDGRFIVDLPFKSDPGKLGQSKDICIKRLYAVEKRLSKDSSLKTKYHSFMREYFDLDHMEEVTENEQDNDIVHYLPHHPVVRDDHETTKLRVVFDGSCATSNGNSLNDTLFVGPTIQPDLWSILLRFRQHKYVLAADIRQMYRQINVAAHHQNLQRIVWRWDRNENVKSFRLKTVTYGLSSSPYLAIRCLQQTAHDNMTTYPIAGNVILQDFYVDDVLTGHDDLSQLIQIKQDVIHILETAQFQLSKWKANHPSLIASTEVSHERSFSLGEGTKVLGLIWNPEADTLQYKLNCSNVSRQSTKRNILSVVSQIFDPLGLIGPITVIAKSIMQHLWKLNCGWDESVSLELHSRWQIWLQQSCNINAISIPRRVMSETPIETELHAFCDASELAYGVCVYLRIKTASGMYSTQLYCSKSKIAPLKKISVPRLELCAALLLATLCHRIYKSITIHIDNSYYWSDSTIALCWILGEPHRWSTFVANRVTEIQRLTDKHHWHHVRSEHNPADVISRGIYPQELIDCSLWWYGPEFLRQPIRYDDSNASRYANLTEPPEERKSVVSLKVTQVTKNEFAELLLNKFSSLTRLKRVVAFCLRFRVNRLKTAIRYKGPLTVTELENSMLHLIKLVQADAFQNEIHDLENKELVSQTSKLKLLHPFLDGDKVIRVGGRLSNAIIEYSQKHPIILPANHPFTTLVIRNEHYLHLHAGPQALLASLRTRFWILSGKTSIRRTLRRCIVCFRNSPRKTEQLMGSLPLDRVQPSRPFLVTGVDYAGPFSIKISRNVTGKAYLCVFVCFSTHAVHLEIVSSLTTEAFLAALKRFISRRGICKTIYSDNGSNFVGADAALRNLLQNFQKNDSVSQYLTSRSINWVFIPPYSPHMGGLWESAVKSAKLHFKKIIGSVKLNFEELCTLFAQIEACLNSRPITPLSQDSSDLHALTPGHFLIGEQLTAIPEEDLTQTPTNRLNRWNLLTQLKQQFWSRWSQEYLSLLQQRNKWLQPNTSLTPGMMILIRSETTRPMNWPLGRILETHPGKDGLVRVVTIKTSTGTCQRAVSKICILPIEDNESSISNSLSKAD